MAIFYWKGGVDTAWATVANWFKDEALSVAAGAFPNDSAAIAVIPLGGPQRDIATLGANRTVAAFIDLTNGDYSFKATDFTLTVGSAIFLGTGINWGKIAGNCVFKGDYSYNLGTITGTCIFSGAGSYNIGTITGNCVFSGVNSNNGGTITGDATFQTGTGMYNSGTITGSLLALVPLGFNTGTAGKYPLDVLNTGI